MMKLLTPYAFLDVMRAEGNFWYLIDLGQK